MKLRFDTPAVVAACQEFTQLCNNVIFKRCLEALHVLPVAYPIQVESPLFVRGMRWAVYRKRYGTFQPGLTIKTHHDESEAIGSCRLRRPADVKLRKPRRLHYTHRKGRGGGLEWRCRTYRFCRQCLRLPQTTAQTSTDRLSFPTPIPDAGCPWHAHKPPVRNCVSTVGRRC